MDIPFMRLDRQYENLKQEILPATTAVFEHGRVLQGPEVKELENQLARFFGLSHCLTVNSGTDALIFALQALSPKPRPRVAVTSLSFVASASAIVHAGGVPIFVDIDKFYLTQTERLLDLIRKDKIDGIVAVHLYGQMMGLKDVYQAAKQKGIFVIEDAAQCFGATRQGLPPGKHSDAVCLSFDPTKVISAYGSGGAVLTNLEEVKKRVTQLRYHGHIGNRIYEKVGFNSQLATIQAAAILVKMKHVEMWQKRRIEIAQRFNQELSPLKKVLVPEVMTGNEHIFHKYVIRVKGDRDQLAGYLKSKGVETSIHYSLGLHQQPCFKKFKKIQEPLPSVEKAVLEILSLPIYPELTDDEAKYICGQIKSFLN